MKLHAGIPSFRPRMAGGSAFWAMIRRVTIVAGCIHAAWVVMNAALGAPFMAAVNVGSVLVYMVAYVLILRRRNQAALTLIWVEVMCHTTLSSLLLGWEGGFHYFLLIFIPAISAGSYRRLAVPLVLVLLVSYLGLEAVCDAVGPLSPIDPHALRAVRWFNVMLIFILFSSMVRSYRATVLKAEKRLFVAASTDPLTGLANRSHFQSRATTALAHCRRNGGPVSLMLADVDHFKRINDEHGHEAGDKVLVRVASLISSSLRDIDVLARWGGEEFLALLPGTDGVAAAAVAERVRRGVAEMPVDIGGQNVHVTVSFGIAEVRGDADLQPATARADLALYRSKETGRNRVTCAPEEPALA